MNYRNNVVIPRIRTAIALIALIGLAGVASAQETRVRLGLQTGMQTSLLRYTVVPYTGEFQAAIDEGAVHGLSFCLDFDPVWSVLVDFEWKHNQWNERRGEDPRIEIDMAKRTTLAVPVLLLYRPPIPAIPLYLAIGAALTVVPDNRARFSLSYTGFTERDGWQTYTSSMDQSWGGINAVAEAGFDVAIGSSFSLLLAARYQQPFSDIVAGDRLKGELLSIWRLRAALYIGI